MIKLRYVKKEDAKRFYEILNKIDTKYYYSTIPKSIESERKWIERRKYKREKNQEYNYTIIYKEKVVGGCGITIYREYDHVGEIGYFVDNEFAGKGIATQAVRLLEKKAFNDLSLVRLEIRMDPLNKASEKVAIKNGYKKEGLLKKIIKFQDNYYDNFLYAKIRA